MEKLIGTYYWRKEKAGWVMSERQTKKAIVSEVQYRMDSEDGVYTTLHMLKRLEDGKVLSFIAYCGGDRQVGLIRVLDRLVS